MTKQQEEGAESRFGCADCMYWWSGISNVHDDDDRVGRCNCGRSDHNQHVIGEGHSICEAFCHRLVKENNGESI